MPFIIVSGFRPSVAVAAVRQCSALPSRGVAGYGGRVWQAGPVPCHLTGAALQSSLARHGHFPSAPGGRSHDGGYPGLPLFGYPFRAWGSDLALGCLFLCFPCFLPVVWVVRQALGGGGPLGAPISPRQRFDLGPFLPVPGGCWLLLGLYSSLLGSGPAAGFTLAL